MADLVRAYLDGGARAFFGAHPGDAADRLRAVRAVARPLAPAVAAALEAQGAKLPPSAARDANLAALRTGAAAVVTGQQVGLFLGPLYTLYKAASAVRLARLLSEESGTRVMPVFWLQTEDHDLQEIAWCALPGRHGGTLTLRLPADPQDRRSIAHRTLPPELDGCFRELDGALGGAPHGPALLALLHRHYRPGAGWGAAFAGVLAELFAEEGLVIVDPRDPALAAAGAALHRRALEEAGPISAALLGRSRALQAEGHAAPIHVREGAPLAFFHPEGPLGPRFRLEPRGGGSFAEVGGQRVFRQAELLQALQDEPRSFSTSALLRPLLQDTLLPTAAYVGGAAELAYFAQLGPLYSHLGLQLPLVVHRARFRLVDEKARRLLAELGATAQDAALPTDELLARCKREPSGMDAASVKARLLGPFEEALFELAPELEAAGPQLPKALRRTRAAVERTVTRLAAQHQRALLRKDEALVEKVERLRARLHPDGAPQERRHGLPAYAASAGGRALVERVLAAISPLDPSLQDLFRENSFPAPHSFEPLR